MKKLSFVLITILWVMGGVHQLKAQPGANSSIKMPNGTVYRWGDPVPKTQINNSNSYIKQPDGSVYRWGDPVHAKPIDNSNSYIKYPDGSVYHWNDAKESNTSSNSKRNASSSRNKCYTCNGTGRVADDVTKESVSSFGIKPVRMGKCDECGQTRDLNTHYHKTCPNCHGSGYK